MFEFRRGFFFASMKLVEDHFSGASVLACPPMLACGEMHREEMLPLLPGPILAHRGLLVWALMQSLIAMSRCRGVRLIQTWRCVAAHLLCRVGHGEICSCACFYFFTVLLLVLFS